MSEQPSFVCRSCSRRVTAGSYRASCPDCGGGLRRIRYDERGTY